ncbi:MAG: SulP family inorganic anion transporter [Alphaproteobacteria bacterium]|nr:SulP family inorganic anion transporter [Alphaproteobacteria bacterium]
MFRSKIFGKRNELFPAFFNVYVERYSFFHLCNDIWAGIKIFALLFPVLISLAILCGESPIVGLISGITSIAISVILSNTRYQISQISFPTCVVVTEIMIKYQYKGVFITALFVCLILYVFGKLNIGEVLKCTASAFLSAIYVYVAISILVSQIQYILGISTPAIFNSTFANIAILCNSIRNITVSNLQYAISFFGLLVLLSLVFKGYISFFIYILLCAITMLCSEFNLLPYLEYLNIKTIGIGLFNCLDSNNIFLLSYNIPSQTVLGNLVIFAFAISLVIASQVSFCISIGTSITLDKKLQTNKELILTGISNLVSVSCGGLFISPDTELSIQNIHFKSKSLLSILITGLLLYIILCYKDYIFNYIPTYAISSILIMLSVSVIRNADITQYMVSKNKEKYIFWTTVNIALYFGFVPAVFAGFVLSLFTFSRRIINIKNPSVYTNKDHDSIVREFISNKYGYLNTQKISKEIFEQVEIIQIENILSINLLEMIRKTFISRDTFPKFIILYFQNVPFLDGEAFRLLKKFVSATNKLGSTVILCGTNGLLLELIKKKEKESNVNNIFGYIIPNFSDAVSKILKTTKLNQN